RAAARTRRHRTRASGPDRRPLPARQRQPFVAQQRHANDVGEFAALEERVPHGSLRAEAGLLIAAARAKVLSIDVEPEPLEAQRSEAEVGDGDERVGPIALVPLRLLANRDAEGGAPSLEVDLM